MTEKKEKIGYMKRVKERRKKWMRRKMKQKI